MKKILFVPVSLWAAVAGLAALTATEPDGKAALGKRLFFDPTLSRDSTISCASCHRPEFAFSDTSATSAGVGGARGTRNTPSAMNVRLQRVFFWDGRAGSLEEQALAPIENGVEMNLPFAEALDRLRRNKTYQDAFTYVFGTEPTRETLAQALAAFERTLETSNSPFDKWRFWGDTAAVSSSVKRGFALFNTKGKCSQCHFGADFTANELRNIGLFDGKALNDSGQSAITGKKEDLGKFKIGSLRNIAVTAPYMHNGMLTTLEDVVEFYNDPKKFVPHAQNTDTLLRKPLDLTKQEKKDLVAFLESLTDSQFVVKRRAVHAQNSRK